MSNDPRDLLLEAQRLLDGGDPEEAAHVLEPVTADPHYGTDAWILIGTARYRYDDEAGALDAWQRAAESGGPSAWLGWRSVAEQHVRNGDLDDAIAAYREADRRAPAAERGAIANRIAWLLKETGHDFAARRQFNRARGAYGTFGASVTMAIIAINVLVFLADAATNGFAGLSLWGGYGKLMEAGWVSTRRSPTASGGGSSPACSCTSASCTSPSTCTPSTCSGRSSSSCTATSNTRSCTSSAAWVAVC